MSYFSGILAHQQNTVPATSAEGAGLGVHTDIAHRTGIKGDRLVNQLFACTFSYVLLGQEWLIPLIRYRYEPSHQRIHRDGIALHQAILRRVARHAW